MTLPNIPSILRHSLSLVVIVGLPLLSCSQKSSTEQPPASDVIKPPYAWNTFSMGVDLSYVNEVEDFGGKFSDSAGVTDPFVILKNHGANTVRVRLWYNPAWVGELTGGHIYSDLADVAKTIQRAKSAGMAVSLDIHYSDTWADPDHQETPAAWTGLALPALSDSVYAYTLRALNYFGERNLTPEMVQVGNETNNGMLWPVGKVQNDYWQSFGTLLNSGIRAVKDFSVTSSIKPKIILHVAQMQYATWWIEGIVRKGKVSGFDILGISHYSKWSTIKSMAQITQIIRSVRSTYGCGVMVVETAYPWTGLDADTYKNLIGAADSVVGYPITIAGQQKYFEDLTQAVISGGGTGIQYWEPAWITSSMKDKWGTGSSWDNCTLFDFNGKALESINFMRRQYTF